MKCKLKFYILEKFLFHPICISKQKKTISKNLRKVSERTSACPELYNFQSYLFGKKTNPSSPKNLIQISAKL